MSIPRSRIIRGVAIVTLLSVVSPAGRAVASPLQDFIGDTGSPAAMQARTVAGGSAAAYFNPALLCDAPAGAAAGFVIVHQGYGIELDGRPGTEFAIPEGIETFGHADTTRFDNYPIATNLLQNGRETTARRPGFDARPRQGAGSGHGTRTYETVGLVVKALNNRVTIGFHGLIPNGEFTKMRAFFNDEREQYFSNSLHPELYSDRMLALSMALGLGIQLSENLSIGAGTTFALKAAVVAGAYVADTGNLGAIQLDMDASVNIGISPHFGISYKPTERLRLTATAHTPQHVELGSSFKFLLSSGIEQSSGLTFVLDYTPWQIGLGASYDLLQEKAQTLTVAATALYADWSSYIDRHGQKPSPGFAWADTLSPTIGVRYRLGDVSTSLDLAYAATPVPPQRGRTNYVDNDRASGSVGTQYDFRLFGWPMNVGAQLQVHRLVPRHQAKLATPTRADGAVLAPERVKDELPDDAQKSGSPVAGAEGLQTNNPGWPGFASGGYIVSAAVYLSLAL
jgi:long-chain fatty acid transport protein